MSDFGNIRPPTLTEPGVKYFLNETLKNCHRLKEKYNNIVLNVALFVLFFVILGMFLLYKYKGKLTAEEREEKEVEKKRYILSKIQSYQNAKLRAQQSLITGLPHWENELSVL